MFDKIKIFLKEVLTESKKVDWPTRQETLRYTGIVLGISAGTALFLGLIDFIFVKLLGQIVL